MNYLPTDAASYPRRLECWGIYWRGNWRNTPHTFLPAAKEGRNVVKVSPLPRLRANTRLFELPALSWDASSPLCCRITRTSLMVHMYIVTNTTIFLIVRLLLLRYNYMFRPSLLAIFRLYMTYLSSIYLWVGSLQFVGWGGFEISFCVCGRGVDRVCLGGFVKISFMSTNSYVYKLVNFFCICHLILEKLYYHGLRLKCYGLVYTVFAYFGLFVYHLYKPLSCALDAMYNNHYLRSVAKSLTKL